MPIPAIDMEDSEQELFSQKAKLEAVRLTDQVIHHTARAEFLHYCLVIVCAMANRHCIFYLTLLISKGKLLVKQLLPWIRANVVRR